jgi:hypothetical protein
MIITAKNIFFILLGFYKAKFLLFCKYAVAVFCISFVIFTGYNSLVLLISIQITITNNGLFQKVYAKGHTYGCKAGRSGYFRW